MASTASFVGEYLHSVDAKGRVALPSKFREALGPRFIIARGLDKCLFVYPREEWAVLLDKLREMPLNKQEARAYVRYFLSGADEVEPDRQGRIVLQSGLREYAGIGKEVYILGVGNRIEIWDKDAWEKAKKELEQSFSKMAENVAGI